LKKYYEWIKDKTNLEDVILIEAKDYLKDQCPHRIAGKEFKKKAISIKY
jgi:hypothetical protein